MNKLRYYNILGITSASSKKSMRERYFVLLKGVIEEYAKCNSEFRKAKQNHSSDLAEKRNSLTMAEMTIKKINTAYEVLEDENEIMPDEEFVSKLDVSNMYQLLGVSKDATANAIRTRYIALVSRLVPEIVSNSTDPEKTKKAIFLLRKLNLSFENLLDAEKRKIYNEKTFSTPRVNQEPVQYSAKAPYIIIFSPTMHRQFQTMTSSKKSIEVEITSDVVGYKMGRSNKMAKVLTITEGEPGLLRKYPVIAEFDEIEFNSTYFQMYLKNTISDPKRMQNCLLNDCSYLGNISQNRGMYTASRDDEFIESLRRYEEMDRTHSEQRSNRRNVVILNRNGISPVKFSKRGIAVINGVMSTMCEYSSTNSDGELTKGLIYLDDVDWEVLSGNNEILREELIDEKLSYSSVKRALKIYGGYCGDDDEVRKIMIERGRRESSWEK